MLFSLQNEIFLEKKPKQFLPLHNGPKSVKTRIYWIHFSNYGFATSSAADMWKKHWNNDHHWSKQRNQSVETALDQYRIFARKGKNSWETKQWPIKNGHFVKSKTDRLIAKRSYGASSGSLVARLNGGTLQHGTIDWFHSCFMEIQLAAGIWIDGQSRKHFCLKLFW